jgi:hypothetical protein
MVDESKVIIGRDEYIWLVRAGIKRIPARVDTGARTTSIWASDIREIDGRLEYKLFGKGSEYYNGETQIANHFEKVVVSSSNGVAQVRYYIPLTVQLRKRRILTHCTLSDRSAQAYPVLIGRNTLRGKFIVDVQHGSRKLGEMDKKRYDELQKLLGKD